MLADCRLSAQHACLDRFRLHRSSQPEHQEGASRPIVSSFTDAEHLRAGTVAQANPWRHRHHSRSTDGDVCMVPEGLECCLGQRQVLLRPEPFLINPRFLHFALQSAVVQNQIAWSEGTGSTVSNLRIPVLKALAIPTPSRAAQDFDCLDARRTRRPHRPPPPNQRHPRSHRFKPCSSPGSWTSTPCAPRPKAASQSMDAATAAPLPQRVRGVGAGVDSGVEGGNLRELCQNIRQQAKQACLAGQRHRTLAWSTCREDRLR